MSGDVHAGFCERREVRSLPATHPPLFYFKTVPEVCDELCTGFVDTAPNLFQVISQIADAIANPSAADLALLNVDHLRKYGTEGHYWQQTPKELG